MLQTVGEQVDGCLMLEEFVQVLSELAAYQPTDLVVSKVDKTVSFVSYEVHESLGFDTAVVSS